MNSDHFYKQTEEYVTALFNEHQNPALVFHNLEHTLAVVEHTKEIAGHYYLSENDMMAVYVAAWFHDTGYLFTGSNHHEEKSVELMRVFLKDFTQDEKLVNKMEECILATHAPGKHEGLLQQIICDADTYHLGTREFKAANRWVREEHNSSGVLMNEQEWAVKTKAFMDAHQFYTKYCKDLLNKRKKKNMKKIKTKAGENGHDNHNLSLSDMEKDKTGLMSKGIQTMLRMTSGNHLRLSDMADSKAHILISVNAIIISVILSVLLRKLEEVPYLALPTVLFLLVAVTTIVISIIATRPKVSGGVFTRQDILDKKTNLLFFGNFYRTSYEDYNVAMREMMRDADYLYGSLIKDIYTLGTVLGRKYKLIRLAYNIFMIGIVASVLAFGVAYYFYHATPGNVTAPVSGSPF